MFFNSSIVGWDSQGENISSGHVLIDRDARGRERPWSKHKAESRNVSRAYAVVNAKRAELMSGCANTLIFDEDEDGTKRLSEAWFCRARLCPLCSWRRSLSIYGQMMRVLDAMPDRTYVMCTLTVRNVEGDELGRAIDDLVKAWGRMSRRAAWKKAYRGYYRALEVTHNTERFITPAMMGQGNVRKLGLQLGDPNPWFDTYHPHFHLLLSAIPCYDKYRYRLSEAAVAAMWKEALRIDYDPQVKVKTIRVRGTATVDDAVREVAKYPVKVDDLLVPDDFDLSVSTLRVLDEHLSGRRLVSLGGEMREINALVNGRLDIDEDGDLIHTGEDDDFGTEVDRLAYIWVPGYRQYVYSKQASDDAAAYARSKTKHDREMARLRRATFDKAAQRKEL